jgi:hypothetical protein
MQGLVGFVGYSKTLPCEHPWCFVQEMVPRHCAIVQRAGLAGAGLQVEQVRASDG